MPQPVEKTLIARRFARSTLTYDRAAIVQRNMAEQLVTMIVEAGRTSQFNHVLELGCGTGLLTELLVQELAIKTLSLNDLVPDLISVAQGSVNGHAQVDCYPGDMDHALPSMCMIWLHSHTLCSPCQNVRAPLSMQGPRPSAICSSSCCRADSLVFRACSAARRP